MSRFPHKLMVVSPVPLASALSAAAHQLCPDIGPNNLSLELVPIDGPDDAEPTHKAFHQRVTPIHVERLAGIGSTPGVKWARTNGAGRLEKRHDDEAPDPVVLSFADFLAENGLKQRQVLPQV
jgi:hypothetical protein